MGRKRKGSGGWELLRYPGLGFVSDGSPASRRNQSSWISFVRPAAYVSPFIVEERPQVEAMGIDVPLPSRTREEEEGLCPDASLAVQPPEGNDPPQPPEDPPAAKDALEYVPREIEIPPERMGCQGNGAPFTSQPITTWMIAGKSTTPRYGRKTENPTPAES